MKEAAVLHRIMLRFGSGAVRLFRRQVGTLWAGVATRVTRDGPVMLRKGDTILRNAQAVPVGIKGESDLGGWVTRVMTQADVGRKYAVVLCIECKSDKGRVRIEQKDFIDMVRRAGGIAGLARSEKDVEDLLTLSQTWTNLQIEPSSDGESSEDNQEP